MQPSAILSLTRYEFATRRAPELKVTLPSPVVYDVGAGLGPMQAPVEAAGLAWQGFDLEPASAAVRAWNLDQPCPGAKPAAGLVLLLDVIEHLRNPGLALQHLSDTLLPGGCLLITTPNPRWSRSRLEAVRTGFLSCFTPEDLATNSHVFPVWPHILRQLLAEAGLVIEDYVALDGPTTWPPLSLSLRYPVRVAHAAANKWIEHRDPSACGMSYAVVARKKP
jgi:2-polyprenyl-3-methyl-5-hydroxy-6-metoxy-1,4-benzoquinol methylase